MLKLARHDICAWGVVAFAVLAAAQPAYAWGLKGHEMIGRLAAESFPSDMPAFTRTPAAVEEISALGPEADQLKGAGESWDADNDPAHYLDVGDDGTVDGVQLNALPLDEAEYAKTLAVAGATPWSRGYLPYAIVDGFEQVRQDFAWWRVDLAHRALREQLTLRDIGFWSHFVGDGSQPLHVSVHFNGCDASRRPLAYGE